MTMQVVWGNSFNNGIVTVDKVTDSEGRMPPYWELWDWQHQPKWKHRRFTSFEAACGLAEWRLACWKNRPPWYIYVWRWLTVWPHWWDDYGSRL